MRVILLLAAMTASAWASDPIQQAKNEAATHIALAFHCRAVTSDSARYEKAVAAGAERLSRAGMTALDADAFLNGVVSAIDQQEAPPLTAKFCSDILDNIERR